MAANPARSGIFYGWFVVATCMFIAFLTMGSRNAFGAFVVPMEAEFEWNRTIVSWAAALGALLNGVTQPFMGYFFDRVGVRIVVMSGIAIVGAATLLMYFTGSVWYLIAIFGVMSAVGAERNFANQHRRNAQQVVPPAARIGHRAERIRYVAGRPDPGAAGCIPDHSD